MQKGCFSVSEAAGSQCMLEQPPQSKSDKVEKFRAFFIFPLTDIHTIAFYMRNLLTKSKFQNLKHEYSWKPKLNRSVNNRDNDPISTHYK